MSVLTTSTSNYPSAFEHIEPTSLISSGDKVSSSSISIIKSKSFSFLQYKEILRYEILKSTLSLLITLCFVYLMTLEMALIDHRSLDYIYGVTTPEEWLEFAEAATRVNDATNDEGPFPTALLRPIFGGIGYRAVLAAFPIQMDIAEIYNGGILLPMDVVISSTPNLFIEWRDVVNILVVLFCIVTGLFVVSVPFLWSGRIRGGYIPSLVMLRRFTLIIGLNYFFRFLVLGLTIFPPSSLACVPKLRHTLMEKLLSPIWLTAGVEVCCYDFMYSGHTSMMTVSVWFWILYLPKIIPNDTKKRISISIATKVIGASLIFLVIFSLTISRLHYSIDVALGLFIGSAAFWLWHATLTISHFQQLLLDQEITLPFPWLIFLIGWLDGVRIEMIDLDCIRTDKEAEQQVTEVMPDV